MNRVTVHAKFVPVLCQLPMITYVGFEKEIKEALARLFDHDYLPPATLGQVLGTSPQAGKAAVRTALLQGIEALKPPADTPAGAHSRLLYDLLYNRFALKLTQEETAYQLHVSRRTINRLQQSAVETLAALLWTRSQGETQDNRTLTQHDHLLQAQAPDWHSQLQHELHSLESKAPHALSAVGDVIQNVLAIMNALTPQPAATVTVMSCQPDLIVAVHPVILHQILLSLLMRLTLYTAAGEIAVYARLEDGNAKIALTSAALAAGRSLSALTQGLPTAKDVTITTAVEGARLFVWITAATVGKVTVLAVDDNEDMVRFYQDCTIGTRYHMVPIATGGNLFEAVKAHVPDVILLDIMLPDIDGWRILMRLHEDPATTHIPVIICTVIHEEALALALGATCYLAKPVRPGRLIQALDQVCPLVAVGDWTAPTNSAAVATAKAPLP